jgi:hypothetical protein
LYQRGFPPVEDFSSPRAWAFALLAIQEYLRAFSGDPSANHLREVLTNRLVELFRTHSSDDWVWFEPVATYDNARLSQAMILSGYWTSRGDVVEIGLRTLRWLVEQQKADGDHFAPIGSNGFWTRGNECARFDQQPLEAYAMIAACVEAYSLTRNSTWHRLHVAASNGSSVATISSSHSTIRARVAVATRCISIVLIKTKELNPVSLSSSRWSR